MHLQLLLLGGCWPDEPGLDTALSKVILDKVSAGEMPGTLRLYVPGREVAFGKRDAVAPEYPQAVAAAREAGFTPVERLAGGRAAVFTEHTIAFSLAVPEKDPRTTIYERFDEVTGLIVAAFARLGVSAQVGEVPGEYCPGEYSVNHDGRLKLMGVGQRLAKRAAHIGGVITVAHTDLLLRALIPVYRALNLEWRPATVGTLADIRSGVTTDDTLGALKAVFSDHFEITRDRIHSDLVETARPLAEGYLPAEPAATEAPPEADLS
ncbi:MAG: lipoate--protein ligase family protein [Acidimicrobiia bacterium]|nr:lipoate--protein ligase family protein [Acidimicrobiia bacterium]